MVDHEDKAERAPPKGRDLEGWVFWLGMNYAFSVFAVVLPFGITMEMLVPLGGLTWAFLLSIAWIGFSYALDRLGAWKWLWGKVGWLFAPLIFVVRKIGSLLVFILAVFEEVFIVIGKLLGAVLGFAIVAFILLGLVGLLVFGVRQLF